jgi:hypothetical protein
MFIWQLIFFECICTYKVDEFNETMETVYDRDNDLTISQVFNANLDDYLKSQSENGSSKQLENKKENVDKLLISNFAFPLYINLLSQDFHSFKQFYTSFVHQKILPRSPPILIS